MSAPLISKKVLPQGHGLALMSFLQKLESSACPTAMTQAKWCLLDALGCGLFGVKQPWGQIIVADVLSDQSQGDGTIFGQTQTVSASQAALCNGTAIHGFELDDLLPAAVIHPGTVIIPAVMAAAEAVNATGEQTLLGIVAGYEATARISLALGMDPSNRGFHKTSVVGPVAGAIAAAVTMKLSLEQMIWAVGLACSCASGIKNFAAGAGAGMVKRLHPGRAAEAGVRMALLAKRGFTAPKGALDGHFGLLDVFSADSAKPHMLDQDLGESWAIDGGVWFKVYPICGWIQGVVQLLMALRSEHGIQASTVQKVVVATSTFAVKNNATVVVTDTMDAQYSIPYCVAVALTGDPGNPDEFSPAVLSNAVRTQIAQNVELIPDAQSDAVYPAQFACRVEIHLKDGRVFAAATEHAHGTPGDPLSEQEIIEKFNRLAGYAAMHSPSDYIVAVVSDLQRVTSIKQLTCLLH